MLPLNPSTTPQEPLTEGLTPQPLSAYIDRRGVVRGEGEGWTPQQTDVVEVPCCEAVELINMKKAQGYIPVVMEVGAVLLGFPAGFYQAFYQKRAHLHRMPDFTEWSG